MNEFKVGGAELLHLSSDQEGRIKDHFKWDPNASYDFRFSPASRAKSEASLFGDWSVIFQFAHPKPNWWWRMWQYLLLGWRWRDAK